MVFDIHIFMPFLTVLNWSEAGLRKIGIKSDWRRKELTIDLLKEEEEEEEEEEEDLDYPRKMLNEDAFSFAMSHLSTPF